MAAAVPGARRSRRYTRVAGRGRLLMTHSGLGFRAFDGPGRAHAAVGDRGVSLGGLLAGSPVMGGGAWRVLWAGEGLAAVVQEFAEGGAVCRGPDQGQHRGCLDVIDDEGLQLGVVAGGHGLGEDGDAYPADGEIGDGTWRAGLQRDVRLYALGCAGL